MIDREISKRILDRFFTNKVILLFGPRQSGKTTLVENILKDLRSETLVLNGDESDVRSLLESPTSTRLKALVGNRRIVFVDEAQRISNIGIALKLFADQMKETQIIATGSSAFELKNRANEPLTGRKWEFELLPFTFGELSTHYGLLDEKRMLSHRLIFGSYPEIVTHPGEEAERLMLLASSYLYKDILNLGQIKKIDILEKLVKALALQMGSEVSYHELAGLLGVSSQTVETYVELLEKSFVVFRLPAFSRNIRNEIKKSRKIYFYDNGIRNAAMGNFSSIESRTDKGALFENYVISERRKYLVHRGIPATMYFWRTVTQQEVDYVEQRGDDLFAFEIKWNPKAKARIPKAFLSAYPEGDCRLVTSENFDSVLLDPT
jgi:predicted AAA+ superfamily ATPase